MDGAHHDPGTGDPGGTGEVPPELDESDDDGPGERIVIEPSQVRRSRLPHADAPDSHWLPATTGGVCSDRVSGHRGDGRLGRTPGSTSTHHDQIVHALGRALSSYDPDLWLHSDRVARLTMLLAAQLDLDHPDRLLARSAGLLHDIGKLGLPPAVIAKPGPLTAEEHAVVEDHTAIGANLLRALPPLPAPLAAAVRAHHERWDGLGYPDRLAGAAIPRLGRLLTTIDVYCALTQLRGYRSDVFSPAEARAYLEQHSGTQFDPECVRASLEVLRADALGRRQFAAGAPRAQRPSPGGAGDVPRAPAT